MKLPPNVVAVPDPIEAVRDATLLVFVLPHQFVRNLCKQIAGHISPRARGISLIKVRPHTPGTAARIPCG